MVTNPQWGRYLLFCKWDSYDIQSKELTTSLPTNRAIIKWMVQIGRRTGSQSMWNWFWARSLRQASIAIVLPATLLLLFLHTIKWNRVQVDGSTLALLGLLAVLPYLHMIRKIKVGEFEAEIGSDEVEKIRDKHADDLPPVKRPVTSPESAEPTIMGLVRQDPPIGLVKLRIELEQVLRRIAQSAGITSSHTYLSLGQMTRELQHRGGLPPEVVGALRDLVPLLNRAAHGEFIRTDDAEELALLGLRVLEQLQTIAEEAQASE
jgi:hypothetical protein